MNTFMKATAVAATLAIGATASFAAPNFGFQTRVSDDNSIDLRLINTDAEGFVVVYDYSGGEFGEVMGMQPLAAGANPDVTVTLDPAIQTALMAAVVYTGPVTNPMEADAWIELEVDEDM